MKVYFNERDYYSLCCCYFYQQYLTQSMASWWNVFSTFVSWKKMFFMYLVHQGAFLTHVNIVSCIQCILLDLSKWLTLTYAYTHILYILNHTEQCHFQKQFYTVNVYKFSYTTKTASVISVQDLVWTLQGQFEIYEFL